MSLTFGTGGIRAVMGQGEHEFNSSTIQKATHALASVILSSGAPKSCAVAYDTRNNSKEFALLTAQILAECGIEAYYFDEPVPTPTLSFTIREKRFGWGVVITASHNPKEYNGYKVYDCRGVQVMPELAEKITKVMINRVQTIDTCDGHIDSVIKLLSDVVKNFPFMYSALYGAGSKIVPKLFEKQGFSNVTLVNCDYDGNFGGLHCPNPEEDGVFDIKAAHDCGAQIILATDPDCDRVGVMVLHDGKFIRMTGNQIAAVILDELLKRETVPGSVVITTNVSGHLPAEMAKSRDIEVIILPTGFKYIGDMAEIKGNFLFGYEESCGYLFGDSARDKDGLLATGMIAAIASQLWKNGQTLYDKWFELCEKFGYYLEALETFPLNKPLDIVNQIELPKDAWLKLRKSGTEPKAKIYYGVKADTLTEAKAALEKIDSDIRGVI